MQIIFLLNVKLTDLFYLINNNISIIKNNKI